MAKEYALTQAEVDNAYQLGQSMVIALILKLALDAQQNRDAAAKEIAEGLQQLIAAQKLTDVPADRQQEFRRAANDRASWIANLAKSIRRVEGPRRMQ